MLTIAVVGQKGGSGKSTTVWALGNAAISRGKRVVMIDTDPQGSTVDYVERAVARYPGIENQLAAAFVNTVDAEEIDTILQELEAQGYDYCLVDTQGSQSTMARMWMIFADRIIIPAMPVDHVYRTQMVTVALYQSVVESMSDDPETPPPPCGILLNAIKPSDKMNAEQNAAFELFTAHPLTLEFFLPHRNGFQTLGSGKVISREIEMMEKGEWVRRDAARRDLAEADQVLIAIEGME